MWLLYIISGVLGISLIIIGYLIKYKKKTSLINDYKIKNIKMKKVILIGLEKLN